MNAVPFAAQPNPSTAVAAFLKRKSGFGREHSHAAIEVYTELKSVCMMV